MFRKMRRNAQSLPEDECISILKSCTSGVLALSGDDGYPYAVPMSYVYRDGKIFFHSAASGHKIDAAKSCDKCSFCVISQDRVIPEKYVTYYRSVIVFGRIRFLEGNEKIDAIMALSEKYSPGQPNRDDEIEKYLNALCMMELTAEHISGKEAADLAKDRLRNNRQE